MPVDMHYSYISNHSGQYFLNSIVVVAPKTDDLPTQFMDLADRS